MGANLLSYQICRKYETTHNFFYLSLCMNNMSYLYVFCCILIQGLVNVVIDVCPKAGHRWCACHIFANLRDIREER